MSESGFLSELKRRRVARVVVVYGVAVLQIKQPGPYSIARLNINPLMQPLRQHSAYRTLAESAAR